MTKLAVSWTTLEIIDPSSELSEPRELSGSPNPRQQHSPTTRWQIQCTVQPTEEFRNVTWNWKQRYPVCCCTYDTILWSQTAEVKHHLFVRITTRTFSRHLCPKWLTESTFVKRKKPQHITVNKLSTVFKPPSEHSSCLFIKDTFKYTSAMIAGKGKNTYGHGCMKRCSLLQCFGCWFIEFSQTVCIVSMK